MIEEDIEAHLALREARFPALRPDSRKQVVWADAATRSRTPFVIVYVHGFSAGPGEVRPLPDMVAQALGANLFFTRLTGHGLDGVALARAVVRDWYADFEEAMQVAASLGDRIVVIATSTGATLVTAALDRPGSHSSVAAVVFLSPNFRIKNTGAFLLTLPGIRWLLPHIIGKYRAFTPRNEAHGLHWTTSYPVEALLPMAELVKRARKARVEQIDVPALFIHSRRDQVVDAAATDHIARRWGGPHALVDPGPVGDPDGHVIAGDALSPATTGPLAERITAWLRQATGLR